MLKGRGSSVLAINALQIRQPSPPGRHTSLRVHSRPGWFAFSTRYEASARGGPERRGWCTTQQSARISKASNPFESFSFLLPPEMNPRDRTVPDNSASDSAAGATGVDLVGPCYALSQKQVLSRHIRCTGLRAGSSKTSCRERV